MSIIVHHGDSLEVLTTLPENSVDAVVCDPPYHLTSSNRTRPPPHDPNSPFSRHRMGVNGDALAQRGFMGKEWDGGDIAFRPETWAAVLRVLKPGGHLVAFSGTRTYHRMVCAIEDAGFEVRDQLAWVYGSGFPKSHDISKAIDKSWGNADFERQKVDLAQHIKEMREVAGLTRAELAAWFPQYSSVTQNWERKDAGKRTPSITDYEVLIERIGCDPAYRSLVRVEAERAVIGASSNGIAGGTGKHAGEEDAYGFKKDFDITAPATDAARQWEGWGTALKPAMEPICLARKPLSEGTVAANVLRWGTGALNIDATRVAIDPVSDASQLRTMSRGLRVSDTSGQTWGLSKANGDTPQVVRQEGRWPANVCHDGSDEVLAGFPETKSAGHFPATQNTKSKFMVSQGKKLAPDSKLNDVGSAARFFYCAKADKSDRVGSKHPTVKPVSLMRWLVRMVTPPGGTVLDPFAGTGVTGEAAVEEGFNAILIEREAEYVADIRRRLRATNDRLPLFQIDVETDAAE